LLYDLTTLQKEANGRYGFSADKTLSVAQSLYEKKVLSYPRTGSRYLSDDVFDEIPDRIALLKRYPAFAAHAAALKGASLNRRSVDAEKVTDHHALIITECLPGELSADERTVYDMVAARLLEAFSTRCHAFSYRCTRFVYLSSCAWSVTVRERMATGHPPLYESTIRRFHGDALRGYRLELLPESLGNGYVAGYRPPQRE
jgi:DNA topoisomerase IA